MRKALVIDDSALFRRFLKTSLEELGFTVEVAKDGEEGLEKALKNDYDLITLDIEMPQMNGLEFLQKLMKQKPTRVLVVSSYTQKGGETALQALQLGALDTLEKDSSTYVSNKELFKKTLAKKVNDILQIPKLSLMKKRLSSTHKSSPKNVATSSPKSSLNAKKEGYVLIGASTGGPGLIETIAKSLPPTYPHPLCVVQHMPANFTAKFAARLDSVAQISVLEAQNGMKLQPATMFIAKGGKHLHFQKRADQIYTKLVPNTSGRFFVPSVDEMFFSACEVMDPKKILAILLTGIGDDGADGMVALKKAGAYTIAESEETAAVYGMPKEAFLRGGACEVLPFPQIVEAILKFGASDGV